MRASILTHYGSTDNFRLQEVPKPVPADDEVLIKVHAASINSWDWEILKGKPFINRLMVGLFKPTRMKILGCDIAGQIEAVGKNVKQFQVGDEVYGDISDAGWGGFAEYVCVSDQANALALKPANLSFEQSAAVPQAAVLALQGLSKGAIDRGQTVLINGASGGVGSFAVPLAKYYGAEVSAVCASTGMDFVRSLGAQQVMDFRQQDFTAQGQQYDLILDVQGHHSLFDYLRSLKPGGRYVMVGGASGLVFQLLLLGSLIWLFSSKKMDLLMHRPNAADLDTMRGYLEAGTVQPVIDRVFPLSQLADAMRYYEQGEFNGKIVINEFCGRVS